MASKNDDAECRGTRQMDQVLRYLAGGCGGDGGRLRAVQCGSLTQESQNWT